MERSIWLEWLVVFAATLVTLWGIGSFGIWDPWELEPSYATDLAFVLLGVGERAARLPNALAGLAMGGIAFMLLAGGVGRTAGVLAVAVLASTPIFVLNARLAMGDALGMAAQAWVGVAGMAASVATRNMQRTALHYLLLGAGFIVSTCVSGVLLGPLPPILAVATWNVIGDRREQSPLAREWFAVVSVVLLGGLIHAVASDAPERSVWLGGGAVGGNPPTWDAAIELVFHGFAPWSAALPIAMVAMLEPRPARAERAQRMAWILLLWLAFGFTSWTVFASRYGTPPFLAVLPLAGLVAMWLAEAREQPNARWSEAAVVALLIGLLVRDYALYPDSVLRALTADALSVPEVHDSTSTWALLFSLAGGVLCLSLVSPPSVTRPDSHRTISWLQATWQSGGGARAWMSLVASVLGACVAFGLMCFVLDLRIASVVVRVGRYVAFVPLLIGVLVFGVPWLQYGFSRLGARRVLVAVSAALLVGAFVAFSLQTELSRHFSPKSVYETYEDLAGEPPAPLAAHRVPTAAARYYTNVPVLQLDDEAELLRFLREEGQRFAVVPADGLARLDRAYRREGGHHLYVADARSARLLLVAALPIAGRPNQSFLAQAVLKEAPKLQHPLGARFEDRVELVGYDLELPSPDGVGAGQRFAITWYWQAVGKPPSGYEVFVHIDGNGLRLNGDHEPVGGRYPIKLWSEGDVIADRQELTVPANFRTGDYTIYVGLYRGDQRLTLDSGPNDGSNRVRAGILPVR